jgi:alanyl-tRNA synthetase
MDLFQETFTIVKTIGQDFKVKREDVADAVCKQKEQVKELQNKLKQLKNQLFVAQLPLWQESMDYVHGVPFLFLPIADATVDELRMIVTTLEKKQSGLYFAIGHSSNQTLFYTILSPEFAHVIDMKAFGEWLKERYGLRGGGMNNSIQGGGGAYDNNLGHAIKQWVEVSGK